MPAYEEPPVLPGGSFLGLAVIMDTILGNSLENVPLL